MEGEVYVVVKRCKYILDGFTADFQLASFYAYKRKEVF